MESEAKINLGVNSVFISHCMKERDRFRLVLLVRFDRILLFIGARIFAPQAFVLWR